MRTELNLIDFFVKSVLDINHQFNGFLVEKPLKNWGRQI